MLEVRGWVLKVKFEMVEVEMEIEDETKGEGKTEA